jgi:hypothetical protein
MCLVSTPLHSCSHAGRREVYGEPCARSDASRHHVDSSVASSAASVSSSGSGNASLQSCNYTTDYGTHNVSSLCPRCIDGSAMTLKDILGALRASVQAAGERGRSFDVATRPISDDGSNDTASVEINTDVPDLGPLEYLGTDKVGRLVAETTNLHWRAYAKQSWKH